MRKLQSATTYYRGNHFGPDCYTKVKTTNEARTKYSMEIKRNF